MLSDEDVVSAAQSLAQNAENEECVIDEEGLILDVLFHAQERRMVAFRHYIRFKIDHIATISFLNRELELSPIRLDRCFLNWTCQIAFQFEARARCLFKAELLRLLPTYEVGDSLCSMVGDLKHDILFAFITVVLPRVYELKAKPGWYSQFVDQL